MQETTRNAFEALDKILLRCWIFGSVLLVFWLVAAMAMSDIIHKLHGPMFGITMHEFDVIFYGALGMLKLFVLVFFFIPWLSIRLILKKTKGIASQSIQPKPVAEGVAR